MDENLCSNLITWLKIFPGHDNLTVSKLSDGVALGTILHTIAPEYFDVQWISKIKADVGGNWRLKVSNLRKIHQGVVDYLYLTELAGQSTPQITSPDLNKIVEDEDKIELGRLLQLVLFCAINCERKEKHIEAIMRMEEGIQASLMNAIRDLMINPEPSSPQGIPDFPPQINSLQEQLEVISLAKEDLERRCNELDLQISVLNEDKKGLREENEKLVERIEILESGGEIGAQGFRVKDLRKQVDKLQDELFKVESSRDEYRSRVEALEKENTQVICKNEELQKLADEARSLKDEVDALRDMSDKVVLLEGSVEAYKKRLEELSNLRKQVKILEEKNTEYMHQIMELEEEVKKSGTWRPQLDLYKKQVSDLHQKLSDEAKKTDRQIFENKKLMENLEAVTQEKKRVLHERDVLKETIEDLKLTSQSINLTSSGSKLLSDSDLDVYGIPPEIREELRRLQHENSLLKKKASDTASKSGPILQSLLNDLEERHDKLLQENRWERFSPPSPSSLFYPPRWPSLGKMWTNFDPYFMKSNSKKLNLLKRNLKWASESDLLILRQPRNANFMNVCSLNASNNKPKFSSPSDKSLTLPSPASHNGKDNPIVIHHIHEFKMAPSPTNEDSGCCRTSPSSCEGCEDHRSSGSYGIRTPDFGNTLDSGVSEMFRCLSPVIPSIVEECTTHHMSDILPAIVVQDKNSVPTILHHSHPSHNTTNISPLHNSSHSYCSHLKPNSEVVETKIPKTNNVTVPLSSDFVASNSNHVVAISDNCKNLEQKRVISESPQPNLSISVPINNRQTSLPSKPEPPDSPTPHNSPRLPHSIHNNRLKGSKIPTSVVSASYSSGLQDIPVFSSKIENLNSVSFEDIKLRNKRHPPEVTSVSNLRNGSCASKSKPYLETDLDSEICLPSRYRSDVRETNIDRITSKLKSGIKKVRSKSLEKYKGNGSEYISHKTKVNETLFIQDEEPVSSITEDKPIIPVENLRTLGRSSFSSLKENLNSNKENNRRSWGFENSSLYRSLRDKRFPSNPSTVKNNSENQKNYVRSHVNPDTHTVTSSSEILDSSSRDSILSEEVSNNRKNRRGVIVDFKPSKKSLGSNSLANNSVGCTCPENSRLSNSSSCHTLQSPTSTQLSSRKENSKKPEITLITDTLFTHFVVSPKRNSVEASARKITEKGKSESSPCISTVQPVSTLVASPFRSDQKLKGENELLAVSDTDTDLELIENRLVSSGYGAPLVSSESNTSILFSNNTNNTDIDPSASEYCTETETEFDPRQFKLATLTPTYFPKPLSRPSRRHSDVIRTKTLDNDKRVSDTEALIDISTVPVVTIGSTPKKKKKVIPASKNKILNGGIIKVKNKTTKAVFAETFNAMFTFCTP